MTAARRRPPWLVLVILVFGGALIHGAVTTYLDQRSGTPGKARVTRCTGGDGKYDRGVHCTGTWVVGGDLIDGDGRLVVGPVDRAGYRDVGKEIDVRIHGDDHATVPGLGTPIMFAAIGLPILLLGLYSLLSWWRDTDG